MSRTRRRRLRFEPIEARLLLASISEVEPNDSFDDANDFSETSTLVGDFSDSDDVDLFRFPLSQGDAVIVNPIYANSQGGDRQLFVAFDLLDPNGNPIIASNDIWRSSFVATLTGNYFIRFYDGNRFGIPSQDYAVSTAIIPFAGVDEVEPNEFPLQSTAVSAPQTLRGRLQGVDDVDVFSFDAAAGQAIVLDFAGHVPAPHVTLLGPDGIAISHDSQSLGLAAETTATGTHFIRFTQPTEPLAELNYVAKLVAQSDSEVVPELGNELADTAGIWVPTRQMTHRVGVLESMSDIDVYAIQGAGLETFRFDTRYASSDIVGLAGRQQFPAAPETLYFPGPVFASEMRCIFCPLGEPCCVQNLIN